MLLAACFAVSVHSQSVAAPAIATPQLYQRPNNSDCVASTSSSTNYFPLQFQIAGGSSTEEDRVNVTVAQDFTVQYMDTYKVVTNLYVNETYILYQCGTARPTIDVVPAGSKFFEIPLTSVTVLDDTPYAYLDALNAIDRVYSTSSYTVAPCGQLQVACGQVAPMSTDLLDAETLNTQILPFVDGIITTSGNASIAQLVAFSAPSDPGALNRAEWLKFMGLFFNMDDSANRIFSEINSSYYSKSASYQAAVVGAPKTVAWINRATLALYGANAFEVSYAPYKVQYTQDAGGQVMSEAALGNMTNVLPSPVTNNTLWFTWDAMDAGLTGGFATEADAIAAFHSFLQTVDVVIDENYVYDPTLYSMESFYMTYNITGGVAAANATFPFLRNAAVYREDGWNANSSVAGIGSDWFEGALVRPDLVLSDVARALNSSAVPGNYTHKWIRNIAEGEAAVIQSALGCLTPATGISVLASSPTGAPSEAFSSASAAAPSPSEAASSAFAAAPSPSGASPKLATIVDGNTTTLVSCPATAAVDAPTICPFVQPCHGAAPATLTNSTGGCQYTTCTAAS
ncbi:hypothetical protein ABBQ38_000073 [Trebouxia sp. C0009 RCD-2024]